MKMPIQFLYGVSVQCMFFKDPRFVYSQMVVLYVMTSTCIGPLYFNIKNYLYSIIYNFSFDIIIKFISILFITEIPLTNNTCVI